MAMDGCANTHTHTRTESADKLIRTRSRCRNSVVVRHDGIYERHAACDW